MNLPDTDPALAYLRGCYHRRNVHSRQNDVVGQQSALTIRTISLPVGDATRGAQLTTTADHPGQPHVLDAAAVDPGQHALA
jgi:hypothetical protein